MEVKTYRAKTMQEALALVRSDLGPDAAVLHTRDVRTGGLLGWVRGTRRIEVTASTQVRVPSRMPRKKADVATSRPADTGIALDDPRLAYAQQAAQPAVVQAGATSPPLNSIPTVRNGLHDQLADLQAMVQDLHRRSQAQRGAELPASLFSLFTDLIDADIGEDMARELVDRVRREATRDELADPRRVRLRMVAMIESEISITGPILSTPGRRRLVALVGPTGVGKTTTIAKLAANFRLKEKRRVGLITVDTYRIAAVEQLRTYADIIELPMEVVSTPREMREAIARMDGLELILMDTAGRSPRDDIKIQELKAMLIEAQADEVHLVLSSVASAASLARTAERFSAVGTTALMLTKLDEASGLGNVLSVVRSSKLPLSYLTHGQNVPDDIRPADGHRLARAILGCAVD